MKNLKQEFFNENWFFFVEKYFVVKFGVFALCFHEGLRFSAKLAMETGVS